ncbi:MAG: translation initiation factor IF-3 [Phycisphaerae bacterium]|nr:translation initiation factor IF-3 [Phycisphaerae bacterium]
MNDQVRISPIRLIDHENVQRGVVPTDQARSLARDLGLDLVEISPTERPPVCRIMDYGKYKYDQKKKKQKQQQSSAIASLKEVRMRPKTDTNDRSIKMTRAVRFLKEGNKVQFTMLFRGREQAHRDLGLNIFKGIVEELGEEVKVERPPRHEGRRLTMVLAPIKVVQSSKTSKAPKAPKAPKPQTVSETPGAGVDAAKTDNAVEVGLQSVTVASPGLLEKT